MRSIATNVARSVVCVSMYWSHGWPVQNGWIDRDAIWRGVWFMKWN